MTPITNASPPHVATRSPEVTPYDVTGISYNEPTPDDRTQASYDGEVS